MGRVIDSYTYYVKQQRVKEGKYLQFYAILLQLTCVHCRYYDDFHTIDWVRDRNRDRLRHQRLNKNRQLSWRGWAKKFWDAGSGWLIVFLVGVSSGILAGTCTCA